MRQPSSRFIHLPVYLPLDSCAGHYCIWGPRPTWAEALQTFTWTFWWNTIQKGEHGCSGPRTRRQVPILLLLGMRWYSSPLGRGQTSNVCCGVWGTLSLLSTCGSKSSGVLYVRLVWYGGAHWSTATGGLWKLLLLHLPGWSCQ